MQVRSLAVRAEFFSLVRLFQNRAILLALFWRRIHNICMVSGVYVAQSFIQCGVRTRVSRLECRDGLRQIRWRLMFRGADSFGLMVGVAHENAPLKFG
jgi:hypothetical protein